MYKIIWRGNFKELSEAKEWCDNSGIQYATSFKNDPTSGPSAIGLLPGELEMKRAYYFAFAHEMDAATFCMLFGGRMNYVSGQRPTIRSGSVREAR